MPQRTTAQRNNRMPRSGRRIAPGLFAAIIVFDEGKDALFRKCDPVTELAIPFRGCEFDEAAPGIEGHFSEIDLPVCHIEIHTKAGNIRRQDLGEAQHALHRCVH